MHQLALLIACFGVAFGNADSNTQKPCKSAQLMRIHGLSAMHWYTNVSSIATVQISNPEECLGECMAYSQLCKVILVKKLSETPLQYSCTVQNQRFYHHAATYQVSTPNTTDVYIIYAYVDFLKWAVANPAFRPAFSNCMYTSQNGFHFMTSLDASNSNSLRINYCEQEMTVIYKRGTKPIDIKGDSLMHGSGNEEYFWIGKSYLLQMFEHWGYHRLEISMTYQNHHIELYSNAIMLDLNTFDLQFLEGTTSESTLPVINFITSLRLEFLDSPSDLCVIDHGPWWYLAGICPGAARLQQDDPVWCTEQSSFWMFENGTYFCPNSLEWRIKPIQTSGVIIG